MLPFEDMVWRRVIPWISVQPYLLEYAPSKSTCEKQTQSNTKDALNGSSRMNTEAAPSRGAVTEQPGHYSRLQSSIIMHPRDRGVLRRIKTVAKASRTQLVAKTKSEGQTYGNIRTDKLTTWRNCNRSDAKPPSNWNPYDSGEHHNAIDQHQPYKNIDASENEQL